MLALANKESLIIGGPLVTGRAAPGQIVPVDSEHSAIAQCLRGGRAGGGAPAGADRQRRAVPAPQPRELERGHPGAGAGAPDLEHGAGHHDQLGHAGEQGPGGDRGAPAVRHRLRRASRWSCTAQSVIHSMVEFTDGSTIAQASPPDMRIPIALALGWPDRVAGAAPAIDWTAAAHLDLRAAGRGGLPGGRAGPGRPGRPAGTAPAVYNAANEVCVGGVPGGPARRSPASSTPSRR